MSWGVSTWPWAAPSPYQPGLSTGTSRPLPRRPAASPPPYHLAHPPRASTSPAHPRVAEDHMPNTATTWRKPQEPPAILDSAVLAKDKELADRRAANRGYYGAGRGRGFQTRGRGRGSGSDRTSVNTSSGRGRGGFPVAPRRHWGRPSPAHAADLFRDSSSSSTSRAKTPPGVLNSTPLVQIRPPSTTPRVPSPRQTLQSSSARVQIPAENLLIRRIPLPDDAVGPDEAATKRRNTFRIDAARTASRECKNVLGTEFDGNYLLLEYELDVADDTSASTVNAATANASFNIPLHPSVTRCASTLAIEEGQEQKPELNEDDIEIDMEIDDPLEETGVEQPPVFFPIGMLSSCVGEAEKPQVDIFIKEFFNRFTSSRRSLLDFYTKDALFSYQNIARRASKKTLVVTPTAIINAFTDASFPAGSHADLVEDAFQLQLPLLGTSKKTALPPLLVVVHGKFDMFPSHISLSFSRTFVLLPKTFTTTPGLPAELKYMIKSDQLIFRPLVTHSPQPMLVGEPPNVLSPAPTPGPSAGVSPSACPPASSRQVPTSPPPTVGPPSQKRKPLTPTNCLVLSSDDESPSGDERIVSPPSFARPPSPHPPPARKRQDRRRRSPSPFSAAQRNLPPPEASTSAVARGKRRAIDPVVPEPSATVGVDLDALNRVFLQATPGTVEKAIEAIVMRKLEDILDRRAGAEDVQLPRRDPRILQVIKTELDVSHGCPGVGNMFRRFYDTGLAVLAVTTNGHVLKWKGRSSEALVQRIYQSDAKDMSKVEEAAWDSGAQKLVVGYVPATKKDKESPKKAAEAQIVIHQFSDKTQKIIKTYSPPNNPHEGGVHSVCILPPSSHSRAQFVTGGDKKMFLWKEKLEGFKTKEIVEGRSSSQVMSLFYEPLHQRLYSGSASVVTSYDVNTLARHWQTNLPHRIISIQAVPFDPNCVLVGIGHSDEQFYIFDRRVKSDNRPTIRFGFKLKGKNDKPTTLGRFIKGSFYFDSPVFASPHPQPAEGDAAVQLWDLRNATGPRLDEVTTSHLSQGRGLLGITGWQASRRVGQVGFGQVGDNRVMWLAGNDSLKRLSIRSL